MKKTTMSYVSVIILLMSGNVYSSVRNIAIIAVDDEGHEKVEIVNATKLGSKMSRLLSEVNQSVTSQTSSSNFKAGGWKMKKFSLGLGLSGKIGIGPWDIGAAVKHRIYFKK